MTKVRVSNDVIRSATPTLMLLEGLLAGVRGALGPQLVGTYLDGSLAAGDFAEYSSDIDTLVVTEGARWAELALDRQVREVDVDALIRSTPATPGPPSAIKPKYKQAQVLPMGHRVGAVGRLSRRAWISDMRFESSCCDRAG